MSQTILIGGYKTSRILICEFTKKDRQLKFISSFESGQNPSWLCKHGDILFAVNEEDIGSLCSFKKDIPSNSFELINRFGVNGASPCHILIEPDGKFLICSNYSSGSLTLMPFGESGKLDGNNKAVFESTVEDASICTRGGSHVHNAELLGDFVYVVDLGLDFIFQYHLSDFRKLFPIPGLAGTGASTVSGLQLPRGKGPRHIKFHPCGYLALLLNECSNTVSLLEVDPTSGSLSLLQNSVATVTTSSNKPSNGIENAKFNKLMTSTLFSLWLFVSILIQRKLGVAASTIAITTGTSVAVAVFLFPNLFGISSSSAKPETNEITTPCLTEISTLRPDEAQSDFSEMNAAELLISKNGRYLYVSNRDIRSTAMTQADPAIDRSSIAVFRIHGIPVNLPSSSTPSSSSSKSSSKVVESKTNKTTNSSPVEDEYVVVNSKSCEDLLTNEKPIQNEANKKEPESRGRPVAVARPKQIPIYLELLQHVYSGGNHPRHFQLLFDDTVLLVANQTAENLTSYVVDPLTGLIDTASKVTVTSPELSKPAFLLIE